MVFLALVLLVALPFAGGAWQGFPKGFFSFPPLVVTRPEHAPFSWPVFWIFAAVGLLAAGALIRPRWFGFTPPAPAPGAPAPPHGRFPLHGKLGLALLMISWFLAWSRLDLPGIAEQHTFFPLWLGFIFTLDGLTFARRGQSLWCQHRRWFLTLFPASAVSWWYFEFLNRFIRNWWYPDRMDFRPVHYVIYSSLCFSTVLPGIFEMRDLLASVLALRRRWTQGPRWRLPGGGRGALLLGVGLLPLIPLWPDPLFWAVWVGPLALLAGALTLSGIETPFDPLGRGDWSALLLSAYAAVVCGFFWELWNFWSSPHWEYAVPYVQRFHLFEMPLVGYTGYLPFGPICVCFGLVWAALLPPRFRPPALFSVP